MMASPGFKVVKTKYRTANKGGNSNSAGRKESKGNIRYLVHREDNQGEMQYRTGFSKDSDEVSKEEMYEMIDKTEDNHKIYNMVYAPGEGKNDMSEEERKEWIRRNMDELNEELKKKGEHELVDWVAVEHKDQSEHDHVHVVAVLTRTLQKNELGKDGFLCQNAAQSYEEIRNREMEKDRIAEAILKEAKEKEEKEKAEKEKSEKEEKEKKAKEDDEIER